MATFTQHILASADDGCWSVATPTPYFSNSASPLRVGDITSTDFDRSIYVRFTGVTIPGNATITAATLTFTSGGNTGSPPPMAIKVEAADNAAAITSRTDVLARTRAATTKAWTPATWVASGTAITTVDFAAVLQQVISRPGWVSGNAVQIFVEDTSAGFTVAQQVSILSWDGAAAGQDPTLNVTYTVPAGSVANAGPDQTGKGSLSTVQLDGTGSTGTFNTYLWRIVSGGGTLSSTSASKPTLKAPATTDGVSVIVGLKVGQGTADSTEDTVQIDVLPHTEWFRKSDGSFIPVYRYAVDPLLTVDTSA